MYRKHRRAHRNERLDDEIHQGAGSAARPGELAQSECAERIHDRKDGQDAQRAECGLQAAPDALCPHDLERLNGQALQPAAIASFEGTERVAEAAQQDEQQQARSRRGKRSGERGLCKALRRAIETITRERFPDAHRPHQRCIG